MYWQDHDNDDAREEAEDIDDEMVDIETYSMYTSPWKNTGHGEHPTRAYGPSSGTTKGYGPSVAHSSPTRGYGPSTSHYGIVGGYGLVLVTRPQLEDMVKVLDILLRVMVLTIVAIDIRLRSNYIDYLCFYL